MALNRANDRVVCLIDMDCFYVQVEEIACPEFRGKPGGVSQYNPYKGGGLIAVNYEARAFGVKRGMRGDEAKKLCPEFNIFYVKEKRGKADLTKYRDASLKIFNIITTHCINVEKASIDEAYIDLTDLVKERIKNKHYQDFDLNKLSSSYVVGSFAKDNPNDREANLKAWVEEHNDLTIENNNSMLIVGALIIEEMRNDIFSLLGYRCSAGIAQNKTLAKLCCGINKPNKQTILPQVSVESLLEKTPIKKIKNLGGKLGDILTEDLQLNTMGDLSKISLNDLEKKFGEKTGNWLYLISHGIDSEIVVPRQTAKSIGCSKNFQGKLALNTVNKNQREASSLVVHITNEVGSFSKSGSINTYCAKKFATQALEMISGFNKSGKNDKFQWYPAVVTLGISATKFNDMDKNKASTSNLFKYFSSVNKEDNPSESVPCTSSSIQDTGNDISISESSASAVTSNDFEEPKNSEDSSSNIFIKPNTDESFNDVDNIDEDQDDLIVIDEKKSDKVSEKSTKTESKSTNSLKKSTSKTSLSSATSSSLSSFIKKVQDETSKVDDVDYVTCEKCNKKILCWEMPEHEDFHFAQELYRQDNPLPLTSKKPVDNNNPASSQKNNKKRSIEPPTKNEKNKKSKQEPVSKGNIKSIENYFKKPS